MKRKVNAKYEFVTNRGNTFIFKTYKCNGYCYDISRVNNITGKLEHAYSSYHNENKSIFFMTLNNMEYYLDNNF